MAKVPVAWAEEGAPAAPQSDLVEITKKAGEPLGIDLVVKARCIIVKRVRPTSAAVSHLNAGAQILSVDGVDVSSAEQCAELIRVAGGTLRIRVKNANQAAPEGKNADWVPVKTSGSKKRKPLIIAAVVALVVVVAIAVVVPFSMSSSGGGGSDGGGPPKPVQLPLDKMYDESKIPPELKSMVLGLCPGSHQPEGGNYPYPMNTSIPSVINDSFVTADGELGLQAMQSGTVKWRKYYGMDGWQARLRIEKTYEILCTPGSTGPIAQLLLKGCIKAGSIDGTSYAWTPTALKEWETANKCNRYGCPDGTVYTKEIKTMQMCKKIFADQGYRMEGAMAKAGKMEKLGITTEDVKGLYTHWVEEYLNNNITTSKPVCKKYPWYEDYMSATSEEKDMYKAVDDRCNAVTSPSDCTTPDLEYKKYDKYKDVDFKDHCGKCGVCTKKNDLKRRFNAGDGFANLKADGVCTAIKPLMEDKELMDMTFQRYNWTMAHGGNFMKKPIMNAIMGTSLDDFKYTGLCDDFLKA